MRPNKHEHLRRGGSAIGAARGLRGAHVLRHAVWRALKASAATVALLVLTASVPAGAQARTSCAYVGAPTNGLVPPVGNGTVLRVGSHTSRALRPHRFTSVHPTATEARRRSLTKISPAGGATAVALIANLRSAPRREA